MMWWHDGWGAWAWLLSGLSMLLVWVVVVAGVVWLVRWTGASRGDRTGRTGQTWQTGQSSQGAHGEVLDESGPHRSAREILDERYARGELTDEEYRARRDTLASGSGQRPST